MHMRRGGLRPHPATLGLLGIVAAAAVFLLVRHDPGPSIAAPAASWRGLAGAPRVAPLTGQPALGQTMLVVLRAHSLADRVAAAGGEATSTQEQQWTKQAWAQLAGAPSVVADRVKVVIFLGPHESLRRGRLEHGFKHIECGVELAQMSHAAAEIVAQVAIVWIK